MPFWSSRTVEGSGSIQVKLKVELLKLKVELLKLEIELLKLMVELLVFPLALLVIFEFFEPAANSDANSRSVCKYTALDKL